MSSSDIRQQLLAKRATLTQERIQHNSKIITARLQTLEVFRQAKHVAFYHAMQGEVSLERLWKSAASQGTQCYFPICQADSMLFVPVTPKTVFVRRALGVFEPEIDISEAISITQLDLAIFPLVAFDEFGVRLGMGKGNYDRAFAFDHKQAHNQPIRLGVAHEFQRQAVISKQPWDVLLHGTVTERQVYWTN